MCAALSGKLRQLRAAAAGSSTRISGRNYRRRRSRSFAVGIRNFDRDFFGIRPCSPYVSPLSRVVHTVHMVKSALSEPQLKKLRRRNRTPHTTLRRNSLPQYRPARTAPRFGRPFLHIPPAVGFADDLYLLPYHPIRSVKKSYKRLPSYGVSGPVDSSPHAGLPSGNPSDQTSDNPHPAFTDAIPKTQSQPKSARFGCLYPRYEIGSFALPEWSAKAKPMHHQTTGRISTQERATERRSNQTTNPLTTTIQEMEKGIAASTVGRSEE